MPTKYPEEMKRKVVALANNGKKIKDIIDEYWMSRSTLHKWIKDYNNSGSFSTKNNRTDKEKELIKKINKNAHSKKI